MKLEEKLKLAKEKGYTYNPETGIIKSKLGKVVNCKDNYGYIRIGQYGLRCHQFAWYMYYNEVPIEIDHIDRDRSNNRISNIRNVDHTINTQNTEAKGYIYDKNRNKYKVSIYSGRSFYIGEYNTSEEAHDAYLKAKKIYHKI